MMDLCSSQPLENWVLRDRNNKVVLRDQTRKSNQFEKRYNICCWFIRFIVCIYWNTSITLTFINLF